MSQNPDLTIRRANPEDAGLLSELGARTFSETFAADNSPEDMAAHLTASFKPAQQTAELNDPASTFFIAEAGGLAAGYAKLHAGEPAEGVEGPKPVELERLYVSREWLGRGVVEGVDARVRKRGAVGRARDYLARRVGAEQACTGVLPQVGLSRGRRARVSVRLGPTKGHPDGARVIAGEVACSLLEAAEPRPAPNRRHNNSCVNQAYGAVGDARRWAALSFSSNTVCNHSIRTKTGKFTSEVGNLLYRESILPINFQTT